MKKIILLLLIQLLLLAVSCQKSMDAGAELRVALEQAGTKAAVGDSYSIIWRQGDRISLNGTESNPLSSGLSGKADAVFSFSSFSGTSPYNLVYPGGADAGKVVIDGSVPPMYSTGNDLAGVFTFHHLGACVRLMLKGEVEVSKLTLSAPGGENVGGSYTIDFSDGSLTPQSAVSSVEVVSGTGLSLTEATPFYLFFAPGTFTQGLVIRAESAGGAIRSWRFATGSTLQKGRVYILPESGFYSPDFFEDGASCTLETMTEELISFEL